MKKCAVCNGDRSFLRGSKRPEYETIKPRLRVVDLFCGCGGLSLGIAEAAREIGFGTKIRAAVDEDVNATSVSSSAMTELYTGEIPIEQVRAAYSKAKTGLLENMENEAAA